MTYQPLTRLTEAHAEDVDSHGLGTLSGSAGDPGI